uniref:Uncharacterized protein n=1 Tax=Arundo donax TaxID=35708 RepID=A0A0A9HDF6_ARUDO
MCAASGGGGGGGGALRRVRARKRCGEAEVRCGWRHGLREGKKKREQQRRNVN